MAVGAGKHRIRRRRHGAAFHKGERMNWKQIADNWGQIKDRLKTEWTNLTGLLQQKYGDKKEQAEKACGEFPHGLIPIPISNSTRRSL
jgi:hypothetical protein